MLTAAWLGQGTIYLLLPRRVAHILMALLLLVSLLGLQPTRLQCIRCIVSCPIGKRVGRPYVPGLEE